MHYDIKKILVRNTSEWPLRISRRQRLGHIVDIHYNNCFLTDIKSAFNSATVLPQTVPFFEHEHSYIPTLTDPSIKTKLDNGVRMYGDKHIVAQLAQLVAEYSSI